MFSFFFLFPLSESLYNFFFLFAVRPYAWQESSYNSVPKKILQNEAVEIHATNLHCSYISPLLNENKILIKLVASAKNDFNFY